MTDAVMPAGATARLDGASVDRAGAARGIPYGSPAATCAPDAGAPHRSARVIAETVRAATILPPEEGSRLLLDLVLTGGPWSSAAVARRLPSGAWGTWAGRGPLAQECDRIQWDVGEGPARGALTADLVTVTWVTADRRWPAWQARVAALGARSAVAVRLHVGHPLGVLTAYGTGSADPAGTAVDHLRTMAAHLSVVLDAADRRENLERAMVNRGVIGQAIGLLVERYAITADQAFATLRRMSQDENVKMAQLATALTRTGDLPGLHRRGG